MSGTANPPILVGVDGSPASLAAARWAADAATLRRHPLRLVAAFRWPAQAYTVQARGELPDTEAIRDEARRQLGAEVDRLREEYPDITIDGDFVEASPARVLVERSGDAALTVVGQRGLGGLSGLLLGSVSAQVAAHARGPVVVVPATENVPPSEADRPVVVGVDGSALSEAAIEFAFAEASWRRARLVAVHAWMAPGSDRPHDRVPLYYNLDEVAEEERRMLSESLAGWRERYPDVPVEPVLVHGTPVPELLQRSADAWLLAVGSRGRGGFAGLVLGSTSRSLLHRAPCPVAVLRSR
ncbi:universal stress protein [Actinocatenispora sera]|uniref:universal stress protein n=1 Tax=Actinocatenispora sera TaxID=390989 RepID=UPI0033E2ED62